MIFIKLYDYQQKALEKTTDKNRVAYYYEMGLGKTYIGSEKMMQLGSKVNLVICQKSKVSDWYNHFAENYHAIVNDITNKKEFGYFIGLSNRSDLSEILIGIINYDLVFRRKELLQLHDFTLLLDESSLIQNKDAKRTKFILSLDPKNVILLSGTPTGGKYERLLPQMRLLGWKISEPIFWNQYVEWHWSDDNSGYKYKIIDGYKNEERLKKKMRKHGCDFLKSEDVLSLPDQIFQKINISASKYYKKFHKHSYLEFEGEELIGDTTLNKMLYERQLCGQYCKDKLDAFEDILDSTEDRIIVFYNFTEELNRLSAIAESKGRYCSYINGFRKDIDHYENINNSVTFVQYRAGAMGLNLQKANKIIYFTLPLSSELFEQSKKRIHRIGQDNTCFYYYMICKNSIEEKIQSTLAMRKDYTEKLFEEQT